MSRSTSSSETFSATRWNVPEQSEYWSLNQSNYNGTTPLDEAIVNVRNTPVVMLAYFLRADYEFNEKYMITASLRREGSSRFTPKQRWANFPGISAGWIISNENFLKNIKVLNYLKIRGGYGEVGNAISANGLNAPLFYPNYDYTFGGGADAFINSGNAQAYEVDPNLTWETMTEFDFGIDFRMLNNKLSGTIDLYDRKSENIILPLDLPAVLSPGRVTTNTGTVSNKGIELSLKWNKEINPNWKYALSGNISYNKNELTGVGNQYFADYIGGSINNGQWTKQILVGQPLGSFYVYQVTGIDGDGNFTYSDERVNAGSYLPTYTYGMNFSLGYKKFDFSVDAYGVGGNKLYNGKKAQRFGGENIEYDVLNNFWTPSNPNATNPRPFNEVPRSSTYYIEDGDYLRINNITVGYTFPKFLEQLDKVRLYATAINPFIFTKYSGYSPELSGNNNGDPLGSSGIELDAYPTNKTFLLGLNVSF